MAQLIHYLKLVDDAGATEERVIWCVPRSVTNPDGIRYRLAYIPKGAKTPAVLYDNHHPKGHHKHVSGHQAAYEFGGVERLLEDFRRDIEALK